MMKNGYQLWKSRTFFSDAERISNHRTLNGVIEAYVAHLELEPYYIMVCENGRFHMMKDWELRENVRQFKSAGRLIEIN